MKKILKWVSLLSVLLMLFLPTAVQGQEVNFDILSQNTLAQISSDGSVRFTEEYVYDVDFMNGALITIDRTGLELRDYRIGIKDPNKNETVYLEESPTGSSKTFQVTQTDSKYEFKIYYPSANQNVTFVVEYTLIGAVTNFSDTAEFNRKVVGTGIDEYLDVSAIIVLPGNVSNPDDFRAWGHGAPQGVLSLTQYKGKSAVELSVKDNQPNQFVEVDTIFPIALTPNNLTKREMNKKEDIIQRENGYVEKDLQNYQKQLAWLVFWLVVLVIAMPLAPILLMLFYLRSKNKLNPNPVQLPKHIYTLPEDISPALMATSVFRSNATPEDFTATVVDLARKGYIKLTEVAKQKRGLFGNGKATTIQIDPGQKYHESATLQKHEKYALSYILPEGESVLLSDLEEFAAEHRSFAKKQYKKWNGFLNFTQVKGMQLKGSIREQKLLEAGLFTAIVALPILTIVGWVLADRTKYAEYMLIFTMIALISWVVTIILAIVVYFKPLRTFEQDKRIKEWTGFKNMLNDIGNFNMRQIGSLELWEEYLVYAVSLGVAERVVEAMKLNFKPIELEQLSVGGGFYANPYLLTHSMNQTISQTVQKAQPKPTAYQGNNSGGFGGGFSSGSSGGSGGGSGAGGF